MILKSVMVTSHITLPQETADRVRKECREMDISVSQWMRRAIKLAFDRHDLFEKVLIGKKLPIKEDEK